MESGIDEKGIKCWAEDASKEEKYLCPICHAQLILKNKAYSKKAHFAHKAGACTDRWNYDMSEWHSRMQDYFDLQYHEIVCDKNGIKHRADILKDGVVVEFQHSPISPDEYKERNTFYQSLGYKIAWIFDVSEEYENGTLLFDKNKDNHMLWKYAKQVLSYSPKISDYNKNFCLYLWLGDEEKRIYKVIWAAKGDCGLYNFKHIVISDYAIELEKKYECK